MRPEACRILTLDGSRDAQCSLADDSREVPAHMSPFSLAFADVRVGVQGYDTIK